jgi:hypothetical protein
MSSSLVSPTENHPSEADRDRFSYQGVHHCNDGLHDESVSEDQYLNSTEVQGFAFWIDKLRIFGLLNSILVSDLLYLAR